MKKTASLLIVLLLFVASLPASVIPPADRISVYLRGALYPSFITEKVFSYPAKNGSVHYAAGTAVNADFYRNDRDAKRGWTVSVNASWPFVSKKYENFTETESDRYILHLNPACGMIFRFTPADYLDSSISLSFGISSFDFFTRSLVVTSSIETRADYFLTDTFFSSVSFSITNGVVKFLLDDEERWFEAGYTNASFRLNLGCGYKFGGGRER